MNISDYLINLFPVMLLAVILHKLSFVSPIYSLNADNYLSIDTCKGYRGIFSIVVVLYHLARTIESSVIFHHFVEFGFGYLAVSVFFFLSGYGLQKSYIKNGISYRKSFLQKRIPSILIPYLIMIAVYWLLSIIVGNTYSLKKVILSFINGDPVVLYSWYIISILIFYFFYWIFMLVCKKHYLLMIICVIIWYCLYALTCRKIGYGAWWYKSSLCLIIGMIWATYEYKILVALKPFYNYCIVTAVSGFAFISLSFFRTQIPCLSGIPEIIINIFTAVLFVTFIVLLFLKVKIGNKSLTWLGNRSLEIYLTHGLFIILFRSKILYISNEFLWCLAVLLSTIISSFLFHNLFMYILNKYHLFLNTKINKN